MNSLALKKMKTRKATLKKNNNIKKKHKLCKVTIFLDGASYFEIVA